MIRIFYTTNFFLLHKKGEGSQFNCISFFLCLLPPNFRLRELILMSFYHLKAGASCLVLIWFILEEAFLLQFLYDPHNLISILWLLSRSKCKCPNLFLRCNCYLRREWEEVILQIKLIPDSHLPDLFSVKLLL